MKSSPDHDGPKMAALLAAVAEPLPEVPLLEIESSGVVLIYGRGEEAVEAGTLLKEHLDVTVVIEPPAAIMPSRFTDFPVVKGRIRSATGHFGAFDVTVDEFARPAPSSRGVLSFEPSRDGAKSRCGIILDLSSREALFTAADLRDGYLRADPRHPAAILQAILKARDLVGTFTKPRYIAFDSQLCAHARSQITGCTRCLDLCPAGAIAPAADQVAIDPYICAGCGQCAAVCPTGAASYVMPPADALMRKLRAMLLAYREADGERAVVLLHDDPHGAPLIDALARFGDGLPANVLPLVVNEVTQVGLETIAGAFAHGASVLRCLLRDRPRHDVAGLRRNIELATTILAALGFGDGRVSTIETDDPDLLSDALRTISSMPTAPRPGSFLPLGRNPGLMRAALRELHRVSPAPVDQIALPEQAPFGAVEIDVHGCTLCLSCVSACPTGALGDDPERPMLRFTEDACVQCGLCKATCPENVITLRPRLDFRPEAAAARVLKDEEPFCCIRCGKAFGVKSTIERLIAKLQDRSWMYKGSPRRLDVIKMCEDCRIAFVLEEEVEPHAVQRQNQPRQNHRPHLLGEWRAELSDISSTALARIAVGVLVERRRAKSPWLDFIWQPVAVLAGTPEAAPWTPLTEAEDATLFYGGDAIIELYRTETANYRDNLASGAPALWVILRSDVSRHGYRLLAVTADPAEGEALSDAGSDLVAPVPMPAAIADAIRDFVAEHHIERPFFKRQRDRSAFQAFGRSGDEGSAEE